MKRLLHHGINVRDWSREASFAVVAIICVRDGWDLNWEVLSGKKKTYSKDVTEGEIIKFCDWLSVTVEK